jgi:hypothetical protein
MVTRRRYCSRIVDGSVWLDNNGREGFAPARPFEGEWRLALFSIRHANLQQKVMSASDAVGGSSKRHVRAMDVAPSNLVQCMSLQLAPFGSAGAVG